MDVDIEGRRAYLYTGGKTFDPALPCVVLLHGALNDHSVWALQSRHLAHHGHAVMALDLPGHGRSAGPALDSVEALREWLLAVLKRCGVRRAALVGHSMGSLLALEAAAALGNDALALVMVATACPMKVSPQLLALAQVDADAAMRQVNVFEHSTLAAKPSAPGPGSWLHGASLALKRRQFERHRREHGTNLFVTDFAACDRYTGALDAAPRVTCPVRFILGKRDVMTPPQSASALAQALNARTLLLDAGHSLMAEAPAAVLSGLLDALQNSDQSPLSVPVFRAGAGGATA